MPHPLTAAHGPSIQRGLLAAIGLGFDLGGPGASDWTGTPFVDPLDPTGTGWEKDGQFTLVDDQAHGLIPGSTSGATLCGPTTRVVVPRSPIVQSAVYRVLEVEGPSLVCNLLSLGGLTDEEGLGIARRYLDLALWRSIATEIWNGPAAIAGGYNNRYLAKAGAVVVQAGTFKAALALGLLEQAAMADAPTERIDIHCSPMMLEELAHVFAIVSTPNSDRWLTHHGNLVIADPGYNDPEGPAGDPDEEPAVLVDTVTEWMYATRRLQIRLGEPYPVQGMYPLSQGKGIEHATNDLQVTWRQPFGYAWPGVTYAIEVEVCR